MQYIVMASRAYCLMSSLIRQQSSCSNIVRLSVRFSSNISDTKCPVNTYNEWDPLEEIIVGRAEGQHVPFLHPDLKVTVTLFAIFLNVLLLSSCGNFPLQYHTNFS